MGIASRVRKESHLVPTLAPAERQAVVRESNRHRHAQALGVVQKPCNLSRESVEIFLNRGPFRGFGYRFQRVVNCNLAKPLHQAIEVDDLVQLLIGKSNQRRVAHPLRVLVEAGR